MSNQLNDGAFEKGTITPQLIGVGDSFKWKNAMTYTREKNIVTIHVKADENENPLAMLLPGELI